MSEAELQRKIQVIFSTMGARIFRNNIGQWRDEYGNWIKYGLANPGGSDLIGWLPVTVTPSMVGHRLAIFVAVEVKDGNKPATEDQQRFLKAVQKAGGYAILARNLEDATSALPPAGPEPIVEPDAGE